MVLQNTITGVIHKFGDDVDTDQIYPGRYLYLTSQEHMAKHAMEDADPSFSERIGKENMILVAGKNFGCGSSREHAARVLLYAGIKAVVAISFARIFFRNAINVSLPIFQCPKIYQNISTGDKIEINVSSGLIYSASSLKSYKIETKLSEEIIRLVESGGLIPFLKKYGRKAYHFND